jgi:hypothetical protein
MATYGVIGSPTYAVAINYLPGMLGVLPDNSANLIDAQDVRDVVAGLFENITVFGASLSSFASSSVSYTNPNPTTIELGGITFNSTFSAISLQHLFDTLLYPYTPPSLTFSLLPTTVEYGDSVTTATLYWYVNAGKNNVASATLLKPQDPNQSVSAPLAFNLSSGVSGGNLLSLNNLTIFTFSVDDGTNYSVTASVEYSLTRYWGVLDSSNVLTTVTNSNFSYTDVSLLNSELSSDYVQSREIMTNNNYVVFVWPTNVVNLQSIPPRVSINGLSNNDWIKTRDGVIFTNQYGYTASYDVWRFNYLQGSFTSSYTIAS